VTATLLSDTLNKKEILTSSLSLCSVECYPLSLGGRTSQCDQQTRPGQKLSTTSWYRVPALTQLGALVFWD